MNNKSDDPKTSLERLLGQDTSHYGQQRRDPSFSRFADHPEEEYEEPDRDTDFDAGYQTDSVEEDEEFDDAHPGNEENTLVFSAHEPDIQYDADPDEYEEDHEDEQEDETEIEEEDEAPDDWLEQDEPDEDEEEQGQHWPVSLIAVAVVALVLLAAGGYGVMQQRAATEDELRQLRALLANSASPEEVRSSRGALQELQRSYDKLAANSEALTLENRRLTDTVTGLEKQLGVQQSALGKASPATARPAASPSQRSNGSAAPAERFAPLQSHQSAAQPAPKPAQTPSPAKAPPADTAPVKAPQVKAPPAEAPPASAPPTIPAANAAVATPAATTAAAVKTPVVTAPTSTGSGAWFVNFGSYATRNMAESWAAKLQPGAGRVIIAPNSSSGKTLYRLRVVGLADRATAQAVAHKLENDQRVSQLWVGKD